MASPTKTRITRASSRTPSKSTAATPSKTVATSSQKEESSGPSAKLMNARAARKRKANDKEFSDVVDKPSKKLKDEKNANDKLTNGTSNSIVANGENLSTHNKNFSSPSHSTRSKAREPITGSDIPKIESSQAETFVQSSLFSDFSLSSQSSQPSSSEPINDISNTQEEEKVAVSNEEVSENKDIKSKKQFASLLVFFLRLIILLLIIGTILLGYLDWSFVTNPSISNICPQNSICKEGQVTGCVRHYTLQDGKCEFASSLVQNLAWDIKSNFESCELEKNTTCSFTQEELESQFASRKDLIPTFYQAVRDGDIRLFTIDSNNSLTFTKQVAFAQQLDNIYQEALKFKKGIVYVFGILFLLFLVLKYDSSSESVSVLNVQIWEILKNSQDPLSIDDLKNKLGEVCGDYYSDKSFEKALKQLSNDVEVQDGILILKE